MKRVFKDHITWWDKVEMYLWIDVYYAVGTQTQFMLLHKVKNHTCESIRSNSMKVKIRTAVYLDIFDV